MATLDATTAAEYAAEVNASDRAQVILDALADPVYAKVYTSSDVVVGSGAMSSPWATVSGDTLTTATLDDFFVSSTGEPDGSWYLRFESGSRYVDFTFGLPGEGAEATWSLSSFTVGTRAGVSSGVITVKGNHPPTWSGAPESLSFTEGVGGTYDFTQHAADPDDDPLVYSLTGTTYTGITISAAGVLTVTSSAAAATRSLTVRVTDPDGLTADLSIAVSILAAATDRDVWFTANFESGQILAPSGQTDAFYFATLPNPQISTEAYQTSTGGAGPTSALDSKVIASETWGGELMTPREGSYFLRSAIYKTKSYINIFGFTSSTDAPRSAFYANSQNNSLDWDLEAYYGFSIRVPSVMEHDTATRNPAQEVNVWAITPDDPSRTHCGLRYYVPSTDSVSHWVFRFYTNATATTESTGSTTYLDLGSIVPDMGYWVDWVIRIRFNPFTTTTNPFLAGISDARNQSYQGNRGILEIWKTSGASRAMSKVASRVNLPIGLVPWATRRLVQLPRVYKANWKTFPTAVEDPIWLGFDSMRFGQVVRDGTTFADVNPAGTAPPTGQEPG